MIYSENSIGDSHYAIEMSPCDFRSLIGKYHGGFERAVQSDQLFPFSKHLGLCIGYFACISDSLVDGAMKLHGYHGIKQRFDIGIPSQQDNNAYTVSIRMAFEETVKTINHLNSELIKLGETYKKFEVKIQEAKDNIGMIVINPIEIDGNEILPRSGIIVTKQNKHGLPGYYSYDYFYDHTVPRIDMFSVSRIPEKTVKDAIDRHVDHIETILLIENPKQYPFKETVSQIVAQKYLEWIESQS